VPASTSDVPPAPHGAPRGVIPSSGQTEPMTSHWTPEAIAAIAGATLPETSPIATSASLLPGVDLWDYWPVQELDGRIAQIGGGTLYFLLSAPATGDPEARHGVARLRMMSRMGDEWVDLGLAFPDGFAPGSRQWSGSAVVDADHAMLTLYFTAAGTHGETALGFEQRLFVTHAAVTDAAPPTIGTWSTPVEIIAADGEIYLREMHGGGATGTIKAFRDPYFFRDPSDGVEHILFTASLAASVSAWNGAIGRARRAGDGWTLLPPLITADGINNELERPHVIVHEGHYYCFWSTQAKVFAVDGPAGPTGLYGMVADALAGPWRPLNGTALVAANPTAFPHQAYSWLVQHDLTVISFVDLPGLAAAPIDAADARRRFGGTPAPEFRLRLDGDSAVLA